MNSIYGHLSNKLQDHHKPLTSYFAFQIVISLFSCFKLGLNLLRLLLVFLGLSPRRREVFIKRRNLNIEPRLSLFFALFKLFKLLCFVRLKIQCFRMRRAFESAFETISFQNYNFIFASKDAINLSLALLINIQIGNQSHTDSLVQYLSPRWAMEDVHHTFSMQQSGLIVKVPMSTCKKARIQLFPDLQQVMNLTKSMLKIN